MFTFHLTLLSLLSAFSGWKSFYTKLYLHSIFSCFTHCDQRWNFDNRSILIRFFFFRQQRTYTICSRRRVTIFDINLFIFSVLLFAIFVKISFQLIVLAFLGFCHAQRSNINYFCFLHRKEIKNDSIDLMATRKSIKLHFRRRLFERKIISSRTTNKNRTKIKYETGQKVFRLYQFHTS